MPITQSKLEFPLCVVVKDEKMALSFLTESMDIPQTLIFQQSATQKNLCCWTAQPSFTPERKHWIFSFWINWTIWKMTGMSPAKTLAGKSLQWHLENTNQWEALQAFYNLQWECQQLSQLSHSGRLTSLLLFLINRFGLNIGCSRIQLHCGISTCVSQCKCPFVSDFDPSVIEATSWKPRFCVKILNVPLCKQMNIVITVSVFPVNLLICHPAHS